MKPLPDRADLVVIGGGIMGLATAWELSLLGAERVVVVEKDYLCGGASGRNGGGVRAAIGGEGGGVVLMRSPNAGCSARCTPPGLRGSQIASQRSAN